MQIIKGATGITLYVRAGDWELGHRKTGIVYSDVTASYVRTRGLRTAIAVVTLASVDAAHTDGGFVEIDATNLPGLYRFDIPDAVCATGADSAHVECFASGVEFRPIDIALVDDTPADVAFVRKLLSNTREIVAATGVETIMDDDGVTPFKTITRTEPIAGTVREVVA